LENSSQYIYKKKNNNNKLTKIIVICLEYIKVKSIILSQSKGWKYYIILFYYWK